MEIIDNRKQKECVGNILSGQVFTVNGEYYIKTNRDAYIVNLKNGEMIYIDERWFEDYATLATVVKATLTVEYFI